MQDRGSRLLGPSGGARQQVRVAAVSDQHPGPSARGSQIILTIDVGTSSVRAMLFDDTATPIPDMEVQRMHQMTSTPDGGVETDARELFDRVATCIDDLLERAGSLVQHIAAVAPTTFWHSLIGVSAHGDPVTPVLTWADTRAAGAANELRGEMDQSAVHARTGCRIHATYWPAKIRWLQSGSRRRKRGQPKTVRWLSFAEYVTLRVFGSPRCSISMASATGLLDQHRCRWDAAMLRAVPIEAGMLSELDDTPCTGMVPEFAGRWPALANVPWFPGWGDGATSNVGSGCVTKQQIAVMVGTSAAMRAVWPAKRIAIPHELWCYRVDSARVVMGGALSEGGNLVDWLRATLRLPDEPGAAEKLIADMLPDESGLTVLPFLAGERSPGWHADARATFSGLSLHTSAAQIYRAGHEAIAYRFALVYAALRREVRGVSRVIASGGGILHSPTWMQMMADVLNVPVTASAASEASSRGAALLALEAIGAIPNIDAIVAPVGSTFTPDAARSRKYRRAAERQYALYDQLIGPDVQEPSR